jgi:hypothetical protein
MVKFSVLVQSAERSKYGAHQLFLRGFAAGMEVVCHQLHLQFFRFA